MTISNITKTFVSVAVATFLVVGVVMAQSVWNPNNGTPPNGNTAAPLNVGVDAQTKTGPLTIDGALTAGGSFKVNGNTSVKKLTLTEICLGTETCINAWPVAAAPVETNPSASTYTPGSRTFTNPGGFTFTVPAGVTSIDVETWGGGGGGAAGRYSWTQYDGLIFYTIGGSGGSGGYARNTMDVIPTEEIFVWVGKGGAGQDTSSRNDTALVSYNGGWGDWSYISPIIRNGRNDIVAFGGQSGQDSDWQNGYLYCNNNIQAIGGWPQGGNGLSKNGNSGNYCYSIGGPLYPGYIPSENAESPGGAAITGSRSGGVYGKGGNGKSYWSVGQYAGEEPDGDLTRTVYACSEGYCTSGPVGETGGNGAVVLYW